MKQALSAYVFPQTGTKSGPFIPVNFLRFRPPSSNSPCHPIQTCGRELSLCTIQGDLAFRCQWRCGVWDSVSIFLALALESCERLSRSVSVGSRQGRGTPLFAPTGAGQGRPAGLRHPHAHPGSRNRWDACVDHRAARADEGPSSPAASPLGSLILSENLLLHVRQTQPARPRCLSPVEGPPRAPSWPQGWRSGALLPARRPRSGRPGAARRRPGRAARPLAELVLRA